MSSKQQAHDRSDGTRVQQTGIEWLYLNRGFTYLFWGLLTGLVSVAIKMKITVYARIDIPAFVLGALLSGYGLFILHVAGEFSDEWRKRINYSLLLMILIVYLTPFYSWFSQNPGELFFCFNLLVLVFVSILYVLSIIQLICQLAKLLNHQGMLWSGRMLFVITLFMVLIPFGLILVLSIKSSRFGTDCLVCVADYFRYLPKILYVLASIPFSFLMVLIWQARDLCYNEFLKHE
ncbi:MAG: hypothetical protein GX811_09870 [Lentisphaerae bacterium]|nr:hypothetical protein [Lentisphaerota bacterium]